VVQVNDRQVNVMTLKLANFIIHFTFSCGWFVLLRTRVELHAESEQQGTLWAYQKLTGREKWNGQFIHSGGLRWDRVATLSMLDNNRR
jgi:hypothetical protein